MRRSPRSRPQLAPVNVTPLVDVLLVLVVILLLAMPMYVKRLPVDLPQTGLAGTPTPVNSLPVSLKQDASLYVRAAPVSQASLLALIDPSVTVELSVDKATSYDTMAKVLAQLQSKNPKEIILITR
jgi:biopolymer transport protein ExbD